MLKSPNAKQRRQARWHTLPIAISFLIGCGAGNAAELTLAARYQIEQPSQDLGDALRAISRVTGTSVIVDARVIAGRTAKAVSGRLSGAEAIAAAIQGSGLESQLTRDGAVILRPAALPAAAPAAPVAPAGSGPALVRTGAASQPLGVQASADDEVLAAASPAGRSGSVPIEQITRVEITGSRLRRIDADGPAPVNVYTAKDIEKSGQSSLQLFLASLNEVSMSTGEGASSLTLGQGTVQLRGLPLGSTLVLINGRRVEAVGSSTGSVFNLNLIPMAAVDRIEVVPLGSSAVYGGDALAGVVNVILKKAVDGQSLTLRLGTGRGLGDRGLSFATGGRSAQGSYLLMATYDRSTPLSMRDRRFFDSADFRSVGSIDSRLPYCTPGSVSSLSGNLPGLSSNVAGIPNVRPGAALLIADFQATAGQRNLCNYYTTGKGTTLVHGFETMGIHSVAEHQLAGSWSVFGEVSAVKDRMRSNANGIPLITRVPAANLYNPFGADVNVTAALGADSGLLKGISRQSNFARVLAGVKGDIAPGWDAELTVSTSRDHGGTQQWNDVADSTALAAALAATDPAKAFNPFTSGRAADDAVLQGIWSDTVVRHRGRKDQVSALVRGALAQLPAGPVDVVVGAEAARDGYDNSVSLQSEVHGTRSSSAAYGELRAPLLSAGEEGGRRWALASVTLAARSDHYSDFGSASTFQGGLEVRPTRGLLIRGSAATSFKPPTLLQTHVSDSTDYAEIYGLTDPARGGELITSGSVARTTNKDLGSETGRARGIGVVWEPEGSPGARVSATYWQVRIRGLISVLSPQTTLDYESAFPGFVTRGASVNGRPGIVTSIKNTEVNFGLVDTSGTDVDLTYEWKTRAGRVTATAGASRTHKYDVLLSPDAAVEDRLGRRFRDFWSPRWKGRLSLGIDGRALGLVVTGRYLGAYKDSGSSDRALGNVWMYDLAGSLNLKKLWPELLPVFKAAAIGVSVANAGNREPKYAQGAPYFDVTQGDWRGRYASVRLSLDW